MIELTQLDKTFVQPGGDKVHALRDINLVLPEGQFLTVIGSNGSGKSTVLNAIAGVFPPDRGTIRIGTTDVTRQKEHERALRIGRVFQDPFKGSAPSLTVAENLRLAELRGLPRGMRMSLGSDARTRYRGLLASLGMRLEGRLNALMGTLSGGQRQAVTLLMATLRRPDLLLLDEHTAALDPRAADQVMRVTEQLVRVHRLTTLMVTHSMEQAVTFGDRTIMMHRGAIVADLFGAERRDVSEADLLGRFAALRFTEEQRFTMELRVTDGGAAETDRVVMPPPA